MNRAIFVAIAVATVMRAQAPMPVIDNERVTVWLNQTASHGLDTVTLQIAGPKAGQASFGKAPDPAGTGKSVVIELKDNRVAALPNKSGFPNAFPRPHVKKLLENDRVIVWSYAWTPGEPTPMHFHDKDVVVVYVEDTALTSTTPDGQKVLNEYKAGDVRFNRRDRTHTETLARGTGSAMMMELK